MELPVTGLCYIEDFYSQTIVKPDQVASAKWKENIPLKSPILQAIYKPLRLSLSRFMPFTLVSSDHQVSFFGFRMRWFRR